MDCNELVELVTAFLDDALPAEEKRDVLAHLDLCDGCSAYVGQIRRTIRQLGSLRAPALENAAKDRLLAALNEIPR